MSIFIVIATGFVNSLQQIKTKHLFLLSFPRGFLIIISTDLNHQYFFFYSPHSSPLFSLYFSNYLHYLLFTFFSVLVFNFSLYVSPFIICKKGRGKQMLSSL